MFPVPVLSPENMHVNNSIETELAFRKIDICIYTYTYMHKVAMKEEALNLKEQREVYGNVWRDESEGANVVIIM